MYSFLASLRLSLSICFSAEFSLGCHSDSSWEGSSSCFGAAAAVSNWSCSSVESDNLVARCTVSLHVCFGPKCYWCLLYLRTFQACLWAVSCAAVCCFWQKAQLWYYWIRCSGWLALSSERLLLCLNSGRFGLCWSLILSIACFDLNFESFSCFSCYHGCFENWVPAAGSSLMAVAVGSLAAFAVRPGWRRLTGTWSLASAVAAVTAAAELVAAAAIDIVGSFSVYVLSFPFQAALCSWGWSG